MDNKNDLSGQKEVASTCVKARKRKDTDIEREMKNMKISFLDSAIYNEDEMQRIFDGITQNIRIQMDKEHVSLRDLEMRSGVCFSHLSRLFNGRSRIGLDALIRIAAAFEMSPTDFFPYDRNQRMTNGQKFDEITRGMDLKSSNFILEQCVSYCKEWNRLKHEQN